MKKLTLYPINLAYVNHTSQSKKKFLEPPVHHEESLGGVKCIDFLSFMIGID